MLAAAGVTMGDFNETQVVPEGNVVLAKDCVHGCRNCGPCQWRDGFSLAFLQAQGLVYRP